jgi:hypothetical protein
MCQFILLNATSLKCFINQSHMVCAFTWLKFSYKGIKAQTYTKLGICNHMTWKDILVNMVTISKWLCKIFHGGMRHDSKWKKFWCQDGKKWFQGCIQVPNHLATNWNRDLRNLPSIQNSWLHMVETWCNTHNNFDIKCNVCLTSKLKPTSYMVEKSGLQK